MQRPFTDNLTLSEKTVFASLKNPERVQAFLDEIPYSPDTFYRSPLRVLRERKAHCFDGALFSAMTLRHMGMPALIVELIPNSRDDDHLLSVWKQDGHWGAIAKSNFSGLRFREPVYRSLRELVMSYFEDFFNAAGEKTLTGYRGPIDLRVFDNLNWIIEDAGLESLADGIDRYKIRPVIDSTMAARLSKVDERSLRAGLLGADEAGLFKVS
jgi:hypothetical protein